MRKDAQRARRARSGTGSGRVLRLVGRGGGAVITSLLTLSVAAHAATPTLAPAPALPSSELTGAAATLAAAAAPVATSLLEPAPPAPPAGSGPQAPPLPSLQPPSAPAAPQPSPVPLQLPKLAPARTPATPAGPVAPQASSATPAQAGPVTAVSGSLPSPPHAGAGPTIRDKHAPAVLHTAAQRPTAEASAGTPATPAPSAARVAAGTQRHDAVAQPPRGRTGPPSRGLFLVPGAEEQPAAAPAGSSDIFAAFSPASLGAAGGSGVASWALLVLLGALLIAAVRLPALGPDSWQTLAARWPHRSRRPPRR